MTLCDAPAEGLHCGGGEGQGNWHGRGLGQGLWNPAGESRVKMAKGHQESREVTIKCTLGLATRQSP